MTQLNNSRGLESSTDELFAWASIAEMSLNPQSKRYLIAFLTGQECLPDWVSDVAMRLLCGSEKSPPTTPLEAAAVDLMRFQLRSLPASGHMFQRSPELALIWATRQDSNLINAAEVLKEFLLRLQHMLESGADIAFIRGITRDAPRN